MWWRSSHNPSAYDDDWEDQPAQGPFYKWVLGVVLASGLIAWGAAAIVTREVVFRGERASMDLHGANAVAFGIAWVSAGVFVHCHYFWGNIFNQAWFAVLGKIVSACGFIAGIAYVMVRNVVWGIN